MEEEIFYGSRGTADSTMQEDTSYKLSGSQWHRNGTERIKAYACQLQERGFLNIVSLRAALLKTNQSHQNHRTLRRSVDCHSETCGYLAVLITV
jgi:hypothetical protein